MPNPRPPWKPSGADRPNSVSLSSKPDCARRIELQSDVRLYRDTHLLIHPSARSDSIPDAYRGLQLGVGPADAEPRSLLLHGFTGLAEDWVDVWPANELALALDLPGHGGSADPQRDFESSLQQLLATLPASIDRLVGYSLGGRLALGLLRLAPQRFRSAVIVSAHPGLADPAARAERRAADARWIERLECDGIDAFVTAWEQLPLFASQAHVPAERLDHQRARRLDQRAQGLAASLRVHGLAEMPPMREVIVQYPGRLHWITGAEDHRFSALATEVQRWRPSTRLHRIDGAGHNPLLEAPEVLSALLEPLIASS
ncbi:MAG: alpha/beta fold hydrolase [Gammaproteobacteria bacterium]|jgi:2-succinyl-6-hydroxy-2,4-cyclohexadiene-1-carboxylate synthase|nr:alpha/beta fold hydrolase [Gammaproteobacteria bacterium]